jgi:hypothetical protein
MRIDEIAGAAYDSFESATAHDGHTFYRIKDGSPDWIKEAVHAAHGTYLPNDWVYEAAMDAFSAIHDAGDGSDLEEVRTEFADNADVYSADLGKWLDDFPGARSACAEAVEEFGASEDAGDVDKLLQMGQYVARDAIFSAILEAVEEQADEEE